jgi:Uma2 family endonuclease
MGANEPLVVMRHRLTVADYYRMAEAHVLLPDARVELIDGEVIDMATIGTRHAATVGKLTRALMRAVGDQAIVWAQNPLRLGEFSEPEPDLMLLAPRADFYSAAHPGAADVQLLIEVSDTSARYDREIKLPLYARHGVPEVWIVDLDNHQLHMFRQPRGDVYAESESTAQPGPTAVTALPGITIDLNGVLI